MKKMSISTKSISFKLITGALAITLPLIALLAYNNFYAINVVRQQVAESNQNMISLYIQLIDSGLDDTDQYIKTMAATSNDLEIMENPNSAEPDYELAKIRLYNELLADSMNYKSIDSFFVYSPVKRDWMQVDHANQQAEQVKEVRDYLETQLVPTVESGKGWRAVQVGNEYYLCFIARIGNTYIGAWVNAKTLLLPLSLVRIGDQGAALFATHDGKAMGHGEYIREREIDLLPQTLPFYMTGKNNSYLVVAESSKKGGFSLVAVIPERTILENLPYLTQIVYLILGCFILMIPFFLVFLRNTFLKPINRIVTIMKKSGMGM